MLMNMKIPAWLWCVVLAVSVCDSADGREVDFNRDVRPILSDACFACHGPDKGRREADLRLDQQDGLFRSLDGTTVVAAGNPAGSELLARIESEDTDVVMPPEHTGRKLTAEEKQIIRQWIEQGAKWKGHWSYIAPVRPVAPAVPGAAANEIDQFINRGLSDNGLEPLGRADAVTLMRRLSFDLTGLPPKPQQVQDFVSDPSDENWRRVIDQMLASHHYGERMTALWLDLVRYADTNGIHGDNHREIWMYRDYVIDAFNSNMPFDRFTIEQLAGDLLPNPSDAQRIASGYNRLLMTTREGGAQPKEYLAKYSADRVRNASSVWLGATMACCECHDHKYDPYSIRDFYQFAAFFADVEDVPVGVQPAVKMPSLQQKTRISELTAQIADLQKTVDTQTEDLDAAMQPWIAELQEKIRQTERIWVAAQPLAVTSSGGQMLETLDDASVLTSGTNPKHDTYTVTLAPGELSVTALRLEALRHDSMVNKSLSRANGNFVLSDITVRRQAVDSTDGDAQSEGEPVEIKEAVASYEQNGWPVANALDSNPATGWAVDGHTKTGVDRVAVFRFAEPVQLKQDERLVVTLQQASVDFHNIGRFRISTSQHESPGLSDVEIGVPAELVDPIEKWSDVDEAGRAAVSAHFRSVTPLLAEPRENLATAKADLQKVEQSVPETLVTRTRTAPREIRVLARGNWMDDSGDVVGPQVPHFLRPISADRPVSRMDLAQWFVADDNPLVARVFVNRMWKVLFGKGIVDTADDFGSQGAWPTHPELLDWLAIEFRESGWDIKHLIRLIVNSEAYRRSSVFEPALVEADPFNKWLARQSRFRLEAEFVRDHALAVSGLLVDHVGGRSVKPYQPAGYWAHLNFPKREWQADSGENQYRRGLYTYWCRTFLHPAMKAFDAPTREECTVSRPRSNNSLQALVLLNDPTFVEAARALAGRVLSEGGATDEQRIDFLYNVVLSRSPRQEEVVVLKELVQQQSAVFAESKEQAGQLLGVGQSAAASESAAGDVAAWTVAARTILNLHESITRP
jgi:hypothetical protein